MSEMNGQVQPPEELRAYIDTMATRLVVAGTSSSFEGDLRELSVRASEQGYTETSTAASSLAESIRSSSSKKKKDVEKTLGQGLEKLQAVLETEARNVSSPKGDTSKLSTSASTNTLAQDPELVADFVMESREHLASIESQMLLLEQNPDDTDVIHSVFRGFHTIKGLAGFLEFAEIQQVAHEVETLLDLARNSKLSVTTGLVDVVLESADYLARAVNAVEWSAAGNPKPAPEQGDLIVRIQHAATACPDPTEMEPPIVNEGVEVPQIAVSPASEDLKTVNAPLADNPSIPISQEQRSVSKSAKGAEHFSVRVETQKLDFLMDMVGELVIAQSLIRHNPALANPNPRLLADLSQLTRITAEVQRTTMAMRMIPIGQLFQRTARMVRDLSRKTGKRVQLETSGEETEVDKNIAEELSDPLLHMVRNSLDHGIELPAEREKAGKNPTASIKLAAYHQGGQIVIQISDDGRGLDRTKILKKARERGLVPDGAQLSNNDIFHLIFEPGFSTADKITDISGRGVGMDVVRKNVQKLRGRIDVQSTAGAGTTFLLNLPLTLAIIDGLVVAVGDHRYIVPICDVREMIRPTPELVSSVQERDEVAMVRGRLLPIVRLYQRFNVIPRSENTCDGLLVVAERDGKQFCLLIDDLIGKQEVVIKSLGEALKNITGIAGCAILGDGRVGLILDLSGVFRGSRA